MAARLAALAAMLALSGCAPRQPAPPAGAAGFARFQSFLVRGSLEPYRARGSAQFSYRGESESGELSLQAEPGPAYRIQLRARVSGSLALDVRFDDGDLLLVDYLHESYLLGENSPKIRRELFSLDMSPLDFQMALTGRVSEDVFQRGHGWLLPAEARFYLADDEYRFTIGENGLPVEWLKLSHGVLSFRVEYRGYLDIPAGQGPALHLPARIRIYGPETRPRLILGISEWLIGADPAVPPISFLPPPEVLERFQPQ